MSHRINQLSPHTVLLLGGMAMVYQLKGAGFNPQMLIIKMPSTAP